MSKLFGFSCALAFAGSVFSVPEQLHIALAGEEGMRITWFTAEDSSHPHCIYGTTSDSLIDNAPGI